MYDKKYNKCRFWFMCAELKSLLVSGNSILHRHSGGVSGQSCNLYDDTCGIEVVRYLKIDDDGTSIETVKEVSRVCQYFTPLSYWYYKLFYARPAQLRWQNNIAPSWKIPNLVCKIRGWNKINYL